MNRRIISSALTLVVLATITALGSPSAAAAELSDYRWTHRPMLLFAPTDRDPQLVETLSRIDASRCALLERDVVIGIVLTEGQSTLAGQPVNAVEAQSLSERYGIGENAFTALLIGKDGGEKLRVDEVPDLSTIYAVIDGMPMRRGEMRAGSSPC
ncbi:hypothetical protein MARA_39310 [Mycolicibacterium arabiense]|uniref:DUF4174 domain-containing protein n=2 Tax=Mycolicibacterium arabiense TaxID=1286181 RepID=A0A7I7S170_9MYCO|nr:DUF4174 domain-containing protein [Mycolicibacterium arabiense]BBY50463.1 hypothetical protein MARA_39310 [Mycolicibacterium arabiense]